VCVGSHAAGNWDRGVIGVAKYEAPFNRARLAVVGNVPGACCQATPGQGSSAALLPVFCCLAAVCGSGILASGKLVPKACRRAPSRCPPLHLYAPLPRLHVCVVGDECVHQLLSQQVAPPLYVKLVAAGQLRGGEREGGERRGWRCKGRREGGWQREGSTAGASEIER
jgi:hypothetical protein